MKAQVKTMSLKNPVQGISSYLLINFKGDYLSQCIGTIHTCLVNFQQSDSSKAQKSLNFQKENEDYIHVETKSPKINFSKTLTERVFENSYSFNTARESKVIKLKRLDKVLLDKFGNRCPTNLTEFLFGDPNSGFYLLRDNNLKWFVKYDEILKVFSRVLKPLYKSYEGIRQQYKELTSISNIKQNLSWNKEFLEGIEELHLFKISASEAKVQNEFIE